MILSILTLSHLNVEQLWDVFTTRPARRPDESFAFALVATLQGIRTRGRCPRCHAVALACRNQSIQKCWAVCWPRLSCCCLLTSCLSRLFVNGSGRKTRSCQAYCLWRTVISAWRRSCLLPVSGPFTKVIVMFTLLISIHFKCEQGLRTRIKLLRIVTGLVAGQCWIFLLSL